MTGIDWRNDPNSEIWRKVLNSVKNLSTEETSLIMYETYISLPHSKFSEAAIHDDEWNKTFFPLMISYDEYNRERESVRIHFYPSREQPSWLASVNYERLEANFIELLKYTKKHFGTAKYFTSSTWVNHIPNFRKLFPDSFNDGMVDIGGASYLGLWGQYVKSDGSGNTERLDKFILDLEQASIFEEVISAIPFPVLEGVGPIDEFYEKYGI